MNLVGRFADILPDVDAVRDGSSLRVDTVTGRAPAGAIVVDDAQLLFAGDFRRSGIDLILSNGDREVVLHDYFKGEKRAALASPDGAHLTGDIVNALAGSVQLAQADGSAGVAKVIGHVTKLTGTATAVRNGVAITLNQGDNVHQGDVVHSGADSTLGITFIDGTVFGLGANARMVLNEMVYDPNGSNNSALLSLVQGTISFVAGATAKHGDMKVDTPVATMGIRGTAVLVEIDFQITDQLLAPPTAKDLIAPLAAKFQVLMEPDGTIGSYILFDKTTLTPLATVNRAGTQTVINALGNVSVSSGKLSGEAQKLITDVFALKFTENSSPNTKLAANFTDTIVPTTTGPIKLADGTYIYPTVYAGVGVEQGPSAPSNGPGDRLDHIPGPPSVLASSGNFTERDGTNNPDSDTVTGAIYYSDINVADVPTASAKFASFTYKDADEQDVTASLTDTQRAAIAAVDVPLTIVQDPAGKNSGVAKWSYTVPDHAFDFLAEGETLTLTYIVRVDNNFAPNNEFTEVPITITITGTNDTPVAVADSDTGHVVEAGNDVNDNVLPGVPTTTGNVLTNDTDVDLTDTHEVVGVAAGTEGGAVSGGVGECIEGTYGSLVLDSDGNWTYTLDNDKPATDALAQDQQVSDVFTYTQSDGHGGTSTTTLTVYITGTNDAPVANAAPAAAADVNTGPPVVEAGVTSGNVPADGVDSASGNVLDNDLDVDAGDTKTVQGVASGEAAGPLTGDVATTVEGTYGSVTIAADGTWTYTLDNSKAATQALTEGEQACDVFTYTMRDAQGATSSATLAIDITGANDAPTLGDVNAGTLIDTAESDSFADLTGSLVGDDVDSGETESLQYAALDSDGVPVTTAVAGEYGSLTVSAGGSYVYVPNAAAINALPEGKYCDTFTVQTVDVHGATGTATLTVHVTGANDAPTLGDVNAGTLTDTAESDSFGDLTGTLVGNDADSDETTSLQYAALDSNGDPVTTAVAGDYGSLTVGSDGSYVYVPNADAINALPEGKYCDTFTVQTVDVHGATGTATLTVHVTGANDAPVINVDNLSVTYNEDGTTTVSGLSVTDVDALPDESFTFTATTAGPGSSVTPSSSNDATLAEIDSTLQSGVTYDKANATSPTDMVTVTVTDGHGATDTVNFVFSIAESPTPPVTLTGSEGRDVYFGTEQSDQFVFGAGSNHDTIMNFQTGQDSIDLSAVVAPDNPEEWYSQNVHPSSTNPEDTVITISATDTITLHHATVAQSDLIFFSV